MNLLKQAFAQWTIVNEVSDLVKFFSQLKICLVQCEHNFILHTWYCDSQKGPSISKAGLPVTSFACKSSHLHPQNSVTQQV